MVEGSRLQRHTSEVAQDVLRMGALVEESFRYSHQALFEGDLETVALITNQDIEIDRYYRHIEMRCATILTLQAPVAQDLRILSAFMQLVRDLERIGDYAKDLGQIAIKLALYPSHSCMPELAAMSKHAQVMLAKAMVALSELDSQAGEKIKLLDDTVDNAYDKLYHTLAQQRDIKGVVEPIILLALAIRHIERMADHATNIAQRVSYIVTGERK
ncbi:phosphate signaling complex protein PhoU [Cyanobacterium aponinum AL20118]|uniref:Phosphate-specific transport system accessory protein PhoU n=1 Tax=Cyanobacterium aponinum AL20115 TaxID=3090662 RepID=A0AAF0ZEK7_9CHRO|nr:phosphate signaling complex protein PhoU [Cyanobacterium aponinum]WPF90453.1 phosphate signaling complex protein PhoU [Cyanobacterium aponinum AL20115]